MHAAHRPQPARKRNINLTRLLFRGSLQNVYYGSFEELGAPGHDLKAQHFLKRAVQQAGRKALDEAVDIIQQEIEKAAQ
jgi:hypothetical protein